MATDDHEEMMEQYSDYNEQQLEICYNQMLKLKKLYKAAFIISVIPSALYIALGLISAAAAVITAGLLRPPIVFILILIICAISFVCFSYSRSMEQNGTLASIIAIIVQIFFEFMGGNSILIILSFAGLVMQILCFTKYNEINYLKEQPGYPYFNAVYMRNNNRIIPDNMVKQNLSNSADIQMDEISFDNDNKGNIL